MLGPAAQCANDAILVVGPDGRLTEVNERFWDLYGYGPNDLVGLNLADLRSESTLATLDADLRRIDEVGAITFETEHRRKDGSVFPVEVSTRIIQADGGPYKVSIVRDISAAKAAADHIGRLSRLFQAVTAAHQALLHSTTDDEAFGRICTVATEFGLKMAWVGMASGELVVPMKWSGEGSDYLEGLVIRLDPADPHSWGPTGSAIRLGKHVICNDFQNDLQTAPWHPRGRCYGWGASAAFPLFRGGRTCGALTIYSAHVDYFGVDEVRLLDDLAANISFVLDQIDTQHKKNDLEARLQKSLDSLVTANIELERFSEIYSHHLQEPVRNVVSFAQLLERKLSASLDDDTREILSTIVDAAMKIRQLNLDLLNFSRSRHVQTALGVADAGAALQYACGELQESLKQAGTELRIKSLPDVLGNEAELRQVFINLLSNAVKFASPDRHLVIEVDARTEDDGWHFTVRDNGIGIEEAYLEQVFMIFSRLHVRAEYPGTGTGLAITRRIIERHGGKIWVNSQIGVGTTVHFWLHRAGAAIPPAA